jgi:hypothetical protein
MGNGVSTVDTRADSLLEPFRLLCLRPGASRRDRQTKRRESLATDLRRDGLPGRVSCCDGARDCDGEALVCARE